MEYFFMDKLTVKRLICLGTYRHLVPTIECLPRRQSRSSITYICVNLFLRHGTCTAPYRKVVKYCYSTVPFRTVPPRPCLGTFHTCVPHVLAYGTA